MSQCINNLYYIHKTGYYLQIKKNKLLICMVIWMNLKHILAERKKPERKEYILYDSIYLKFKNRQN